MSTTPQVDLNRWRPHVLAAMEKQQSLAQYAREHGVSKHTLYVARKVMKAQGEVINTATRKRSAPRVMTTPSFVPVEVATPSMVILCLPGALELHCDLAQLSDVLRQVRAACLV